MTHRNFYGFFFGPSHGILVFCPLKLMHLIVSISPFGLVTCEASFVQHVLRVSLQTYFWMKSDTAQPLEKFALDFGWEDQKGLSPVYFVGQTSSDFLKDLLCTCKGKSSCSQGCVCVEQNLTCTELCQCQGTDACCNPLTQTADEDSDDEMNI